MTEKLKKKSEFRSSKQIQMTEIRKFLNELMSDRDSNLFRISIFGFRILVTTIPPNVLARADRVIRWSTSEAAYEATKLLQPPMTAWTEHSDWTER